MMTKGCLYRIARQAALAQLCSLALLFKSIFFIGALLFTPLAVSRDISGFWKHVNAPVWIDIQLEEGSGAVVRNDKFPDRVGRTILEYLQADTSKQDAWQGRIYVEKLGEYKDVEISLPEADQMLIKGRVGFMSRTVEWVRVDEIPVH
ncbi:MAG: DUF2147 domain-containing protein [Halioglobus sp.]|nr:DUF2147 domain-containing protein [Halioglobus sp.]